MKNEVPFQTGRVFADSGRQRTVNDTSKDTFDEELEKEIQSGLHNTLDESLPGQDFTVKVHTQEYVVKRRFYDKDKALETAQDLRKDEDSVVEDNLEGQALASDMDGDEDVDWDRLIDAGLQFDPPIPQAADLKPGDAPVGLAEPVAKPETENDAVDLEKTFLVRRRREETKPEAEEAGMDGVTEETSDMDETREPSEPSDDMADSGAAAEEDSQEMVKRRSRYAPPPRNREPGPAHKKTGRGRLVLAALVVLVLLSGAYWMFKGSDEPIEAVGVYPPVTRHAVEKAVTPEQPPAPALSPVQTPVAPADKAPAVSSSGVTEKDTTAENLAAASGKPAPPPAPAVMAPAAGKPLPFTVHVNSCKVMTEVDTTLGRLASTGHVAFTGLVSIPEKGNWYRNFAGLFQTREEAEALAETIRKSTGENAVATRAPWSLQIGNPVAPAGADQVVAGLRAKGFRVFTIPSQGAKKTVRILAGAFPLEKDTETMAAYLSREGFQTRPVRR